MTGATGSQGGGVVNIMKKTPGWKVRAVTRNPESDAAKKLAAEGIEVVQASFDDQASLEKAFAVSQAASLVWLIAYHSSRVFMPSSLSPTGGSTFSKAKARTTRA